jgi:hypothetical protein
MGGSAATASQRKVSNSLPGASKRPSAYDRFPSGARNMWLDELQAKIEGAFNPPVSPGPSRSPSPLEENLTPLGVAQDVEFLLAGPSSQGESISEDDLEDVEDEDNEEEEEEQVDAEGQDGEYDEDEDYAEEDDFLEHEHDIIPHPHQSAAGRPYSHEQAYEHEHDDLQEEEEEEYEDEEDEGIEDLVEDRISPSKRPRLEEGDLLAQGLMDPSLMSGGQWGGDQNNTGHANDTDAEAPQPLFYPHDTDEEEEDDVMYVGDTDEGEDGFEEDEDVEEDELDDDDMGGDDLEAGSIIDEAASPALEQEYDVYGSQATQDAVPIAVEDGQTVYGAPAAAGDGFGQVQVPRGPTAGVPLTSSVYPTLPIFGTPATLPSAVMTGDLFSTASSSSLYPALSSLPQATFDNNMIDPSLLADFAQRVEAEASGDLGSTTEAQNTSEMNALADAVVNNYHEEDAGTTALPQSREVSSFQHGMGENEQDGYEEDNDSQSENGSQEDQAPVSGTYKMRHISAPADDQGIA